MADDDVAAELRSIERERLAALVSADAETARRLHATDYELITPGGGVISRDEYIDGVLSGELRYRVFEPVSEVRVRVHLNAAILRYQVRIEIQTPDALFEGRYWHTDFYERRGGRWQAVWSQATRIPSD